MNKLKDIFSAVNGNIPDKIIEINFPAISIEYNYEFIKKIFDKIISVLIINLTSPIWVIISLLIKITSSGSALYSAPATGKNGSEFKMYKFRTMYQYSSTRPHEEYTTKLITENGKLEKLIDDPRITPIGRILRKFSIDEFPQLLNVIKGEMSLVGPRPCLPYEFRVMNEWQRKRLLVTPGMTGLWQIRGRNLSSFNEQIKLDLYYITNRSFLFDLIILLKTLPVVIFGKGGH